MRHSMACPVNVTSLCLNDEPLAGGDANLFLHDVDAGHHLGDRMLHLDAGVHLHEVEVALVVHQELERAGVGVLHGAARRPTTSAPILRRTLSVAPRRRRLFEQLLVAPLDRALALAQVHDVPVMVAENLELDVARRLEVLLDVDVADAECRLRLALRRPEARAAAPTRLLHDRACRGRRRRPTALMITG